MFEPSFPDMLETGRFYACKWAAHQENNALLAFHDLNHAANYNDYLNAIRNLAAPGQNCVFASKGGDIAIWDQGRFPAKWFRQGDFVMPGFDSTYNWQGTIPQSENPHMVNPPRGFVSSANQIPVDPKVYPYYLGGRYPPYRGMEINRRLDAMNNITVEDMMNLQTDTYDLFAQMARPIFLRFVDTTTMEPAELHYYDAVRDWNLQNNPGDKAPSIFSTWWDTLKNTVYMDEFTQKSRFPLEMPEDETLLEALLKDSAYAYVDDVKTPQTETLRQIATLAWKKIYPEMLQADYSNSLNWGPYKDTHISHPLGDAFSDLHINTGGGTYSINATRSDHGPSWRMVVELGEPTQAYGIYPGGQNGNPGSPYYDDFVDTWAKGKYDTLWVMKPEESGDPRILWTINFNKP
jgi:penicillin amidase